MRRLAIVAFVAIVAVVCLGTPAASPAAPGGAIADLVAGGAFVTFGIMGTVKAGSAASPTDSRVTTTPTSAI